MNATLTLVFSLLVVLELIFVEQFFIFRAMRKKYRVGWMAASTLLLTAAVVLLAVFYVSKQPGFGNGGGRYLYIGAIYALPPLLCSRQPIKDRVILVFTGFSYGLLIYAVSLRIAYLISADYLTLFVFIVQTVLHLLIWIIPRARGFLNTLMSVEEFSEKIKLRLMVIVILSFCLIISLNTNLTRVTTQPQKTLAMLLLTAFVVLALVLIFELRQEMSENSVLSTQVKIDRLTGLKNRAAFRADIERAVASGDSFQLFFMDLDRFKTINDTYGHQAGDRYLQRFAQAMLE